MFNVQALGDSANGIVQMVPFVLIFIVMYFLLIRPQQRKAKELKSMLDALRRGDRVVTGGGIIGTVAKVVNDEELQVDIAEGVRVRVLRSSVTAVLAKTEPVGAVARDDVDKDASADAAEGEKDKRKTGPRRAVGSK
jgi:preprotein translocase subunit YajC